MFFAWLQTQRSRRDAIGRFALDAAADRHFPWRTHRLYKLLRYYDRAPHMQSALKAAHREWRASRKKAA